MLIAAKGVHRLHELGLGRKSSSPAADAGQQAEAERLAGEKTDYVMIGTFASITYAILVAFVTRFLLEHVIAT